MKINDCESVSILIHSVAGCFRTGEYIGMIDDYLELIAQKTGLNIEHVDVANWSETRSLVKSSEKWNLSSAAPSSLGENVKAVNSLFSAV
ncbi:hypothetical protein OH492_09775 [Vibrio chagasii]|nr:hypothetical protein [Vibrio chagasii]